MQRKIGILLLTSLLLLIFSIHAFAGEPPMHARSYILMDANSEQILGGENIHNKEYPASTTKILTALVALEKGKLTDEVKIGKNPPKIEGTKVYLREGEIVTLEKLLNVALIHSANDAALAIAEHIAGSEEKFAKLMNEKAKQLGCEDSNFINSHGLCDENHYTSAYDLAIISQEAMKNKKFKKIVGQKYYDWKGLEWESRLDNVNQLVRNMPEATGIKSGYTSEAKHTLVASAKKEGQELIAVVLGVDNKAIWKETQDLLYFGFNNFDNLKVIKKDTSVARIEVSKDKNISLLATRDMNFTVPKGEAENLEKEIVFENFNLPIKKGDKIGKIVLSLHGKEKDSIDLVASETVRGPISWPRVLVYGLALLYILQIFSRLTRNMKKPKRKKRVIAKKKISSLR